MNQISNPVQPATCNWNWFSAAHCFLWLNFFCVLLFSSPFLAYYLKWHSFYSVFSDWPSSEVSSGTVITWSHAEISSHSKTGTCGGSFIGHWKALRHVLGCQGDVIWKERGSFTVVLPVFFSHSFYILFSSAARRNLFRTAQRILRTSERVSKGFCLFWDKWNRMHSNNALVLINSWDSSPSEGQQKIGVIFIPFLISKLSNGLHR